MQLSPKQRAIVELREGEHLVLAPPGTGKTEILVRRLTYALRNGVDSSKMLCLTFTNRAARNMIDRVRAELGEHDIFIGNLHSFCHHFLKKERLISADSSLLDEEDMSQLISESANLHLSGSEFSFDNYELGQYIGYRRKMEYRLPRRLIETPPLRGREETKILEAIYREYERIKRESNYIDFDDLLVLSHYHLQKMAKAGKISQYEWLQIDEVQDLNPLQWAIVDLLAPRERTHRLFFGDYEQAIFSFMGAKVEQLHEIEKFATVHHLHENYRSPGYLLDLYNRYAKKWLYPRWKSEPVARRDMPREKGAMALKAIVTKEGYGTFDDEIEWLLEKKLPAVPKDSTAILVRTNTMADRIARSFDRRALPYFKVSGFDLFRRKEIKDLLAFFAVIVNDRDRNAWSRIFSIYAGIPTLRESRNFLNTLFDRALHPLDFIDEESFTKSYPDYFVDLVENGRVVLFDTETTGLDTRNDDIVQIAAIELIEGRVGESFEIFISTDKSLQESVEVHHITEEFLKKRGRDRAEALRSFADFVGDAPLIAHNIAYDYDILRHNLERVSLSTALRDNELHDTIEIARRVYPSARSYRLEYLLEEFGIEGVNSHNAMDDVKATLNLLLHCKSSIASGRGSRALFIEKNEKVLEKFSSLYSPVYRAVSGNFSKELPLHEVVSMVMGYMNDHLGYRTSPGIYRELEKLLNHMRHSCEADTLFASINRYMPEYARYKESDLLLEDDKILIATIHKAKGLEFENVVIPACTDENYPSFFAKKSGPEAIREDARLLYVALTRSRRRVLITMHTVDERGKRQSISRFIEPFLDIFD